MKLRPPTGPLCAKLAIAFLCTGSACLAQDNSSNDVSALKAQMQKMQLENQAQMQKLHSEDQTQMQRMEKEYEDRITQMESEMKSLESKADTGSILNTRILTDADGKEIEGKAPALDESFLKSLTRNFTFSAYVRAGVQFNGNGGGGNFSFNLPDRDGGRPRLGNENDVYMELTWMQAHMLGDSPDVMDVSMTFTPAIVYNQSRKSAVSFGDSVIETTGNDFQFNMRQAFLEMKNVIKSAPEITFWGGQRFYDRFNTDPNDYFWLDTSGYGAGVYNIDVGLGKLALAYLGGLDDTLIAPNTGSFYKHTLDLRLKDINLGPGSLMLVLIGNFEKGATFTEGYTSGAVSGGVFTPSGSLINLPNPVHTDSAWGIGGGLVYKLNLTNNSYLRFWALFGRGATNFSTSPDLGAVTGFESSFLSLHPGTPAGVTVNAGRVINKQLTFRAGAEFYWNPSPVFTLAAWGFWSLRNQGFFSTGTDGDGEFRKVSGNVNNVEVGIRPIFWIADNIAIQGQAWWGYEDNNRTASGLDGFGKNGNMGVFTIAPTIKPKGGYFTRPELRVFATYSVWSNSLRGDIGQIPGTSVGPYTNSNKTDGWLFGTQVEWYF
jgi:maltoporin